MSTQSCSFDTFICQRFESIAQALVEVSMSHITTNTEGITLLEIECSHARLGMAFTPQPSIVQFPAPANLLSVFLPDEIQ